MGKKARKKNKLRAECCPTCGGALAAGGTAAGQARDSLLAGMASWLPGTPRQQQFLLGVAIGAGGAWLLGDDARRAALVRAGMKLYSGLAGGFEELKEQVADVQAEMDAQAHQAP